MIKDYIKMAFSNLSQRKLRSWLTMIGIFIGIAAVVSLVSLGQGLEAAIEEQFSDLGTDILIIQPQGANFGGSGEDNPAQLTEDDVDEISKMSGVIEVAGMVFRTGRLEFKDDVNYQLVTGIPLGDESKTALSKRIMSFDVEQGRFLESGDNFKALAGNSYQNRDVVFSQALRVGDKLSINGKDVDVVGILEKIGNPSDDQSLILPLESAEELLNISGDEGEKVRDFIAVQIDPNINPDQAVETIERQLMNFRGLDEGEKDFQIQTAEQLLDSFNDILGVVQAVLIGIALISLLVGGIGIMNTMYTAVVQRTREIGVMKAIGARKKDIITIFLIESGMLGLVGGAIGVAIGYAVSQSVTFIVTQVLGSPYLVTFFPPWLVIGGLAFSFVTGALSGVYPAIQASRLDPVDALRYE